jgi:hypothetical protein
MTTALDYIEPQAKREWDYTHSRSLLGWLFRCIGAMRPVQGVWVRQYRDGDWETAHCTGEPFQTWRYDAEGFTLVDDIPQLDTKSAIASMTPIISFCVDEAAERMIYQEWHGVRAGYGAILSRKKSGEWITERGVWKS